MTKNPNKEYVKTDIGKIEIEYFESVGMKLKNETMSNFLYRLRIEHQSGVGGFGQKIFRV
jgi:hypothetical protein